jgi:hypothetical protein
MVNEIMGVRNNGNEVLVEDCGSYVLLKSMGEKLSPEQARHVAASLYRQARRIDQRASIAKESSNETK